MRTITPFTRSPRARAIAFAVTSLALAKSAFGERVLASLRAAGRIGDDAAAPET